MSQLLKIATLVILPIFSFHGDQSMTFHAMTIKPFNIIKIHFYFIYIKMINIQNMSCISYLSYISFRLL